MTRGRLATCGRAQQAEQRHASSQQLVYGYGRVDTRALYLCDAPLESRLVKLADDS